MGPSSGIVGHWRMKNVNDSPVSLVVDGHQDIAWNWLELGRHPAESALAGREGEKGTNIPAYTGRRTVGLPECLAGRVGVIFATLFVAPRRAGRGSWRRQTYTTAETAHALATEQLDHYKRLADDEPHVRLITTAQESEQVVASWSNSDDSERLVGLVVSMEGADPVREPAEVHQWHAEGLRIIGPAWAATRYAGSASERGPLTQLGRELLVEMAQVNMALDLSHMAQAACIEAVESYAGPVIASHSNPRLFHPTDRGLSDDMIGRLVARDGVVGIVPYNRFLQRGWKTGDPKELVSIQIVVDAIDHVAQIAGSSANVGIGSDFDGGFGAESIPAEMDTIADLLLIAEALDGRGYAQEDIERIMSGNWLRILSRTLP